MARGRRRGRGRAQQFLAVALGAGVAAGAGMFVAGTLEARERADGLEVDGTAAPAGPAGPTATAAPATTTTALSTTTTTAPTTTTTEPPAAVDGTFTLGEEGDEIRALQQRLDGLGYWLGAPDGTYGQLTRQAVMAFQKAEGLPRDGIAGPATLAALDHAGRPAPRQPSGSHIEIDLARQLLLVVQDGQTRWVINTSTGNGEAYAAPGGGTAVATTPTGTFAVQREIDGIRRAPLGNLYRPKYFNGGIAIHGAGDIPAQPASHGCARVTNSAMDLLWSSGVTAIGTTVLVY